MKRFSWTRKIAAIAAISALVGLSIPPQTAKADTPAVVVVIVIGPSAGTIGAALIGGAATVAAAAIVTYGGAGDDGPVEDPGGEDGGDGGGGGDGGDSGTPQSAGALALSMTPVGCTVDLQGGQVSATDGNSDWLEVGNQWVPAHMQAYLQRSFKLALTTPGSHGLRAKAEYNYAGDVMQAPATCDYVGNTDRIVWNLKLEKNTTTPDDYFAFAMNNLELSTNEVPDTVGDSAVDITVYQNGSPIWTWSARAHQGAASTYDALPPGAVVNAQTGTLEISDFVTAIPVTFAPGETEANVKVVMNYRGKGERI